MAANHASSLGVLHVTPELAQLKKTGGLGDVASALPKALRRGGADARAVMPAWPGVLDEANERGYLSKRPLGQISVALNYRAYGAKVWKALVGELPVYLLDQPELFSSANIYPDDMEADSVLPFIFLSLAPLELPGAARWKPRVLHAHDWPTAALPSALRWHKHYAPENEGVYKTVFTIHNLAHQGIFDNRLLEGWGFKEAAYSPLDSGSLEYYGRGNLMKGALSTSDAVTTVSPGYAEEIRTPGYGVGLDGVIRARGDKLRGILNGIDGEIWNPAADRLIAKNYSAERPAGKAACRGDLLKKIDWEEDGRPILVFIGRLVEQKGLDIMLEALKELLPEEARAVVVGSGDNSSVLALEQLAEENPGSAHIFSGFNEEMAHAAYAGSDILLMPSRFEPCGLSQMIACAYGTIPAARATGGLADTITDPGEGADGTGFLFGDYEAGALLHAVRRALAAKKTPRRWTEIMNNAMRRDFSWDTSAGAYLRLYNEAPAG